MNRYYMNIENGNIHNTVEEMLKEANEMYDFNDPTNDTPLDEYYIVIWLDE